MAVVKSYNVTLNTNEIMLKLHQSALKNAGLEGGEFILVNSMIVSDSKIDGTNPQIMLMYKDGHEFSSSEKKNFFQKIQDYVNFFAGENYAKQIKQDDLLPLFTTEGEFEKTNTEENNEENSDSEERSDSETVSESLGDIYINSGDRRFSLDINQWFDSHINMICEADEQETEQKDDDTKVKGYAINFLFYKGGEPVLSLPGGKAKSAGLFGGVLADIGNIKIKTLGGGEIPIGKYLAKSTRLFRGTRINITDVDNHVQGVIHNRFPQSDAIVRVYDTTSLKNFLMKQRQWSLDYDNLFKGCEYAVTIEVNAQDKSYESYDRKSIADICTMAFGDANKFFKVNRNKITENDVIKIENYKSEYTDQSIYRRRRETKGGASAVSESYVMPIRNIVVEHIMDMLFEGDGIITEGHAKEYTDCINELNRIGIENLKDGIDAFRDKYKNVVNSMRIMKGHEVVGVNLPSQLSAKKENAESYKNLLMKKYMKGTAKNPFIDNVASKWRNCETIEDAIKVFDDYTGRPDYANQTTVECYIALQTLKSLPSKSEEKPINISFMVMDPEDGKLDEYTKILAVPKQVRPEQIPSKEEMDKLYDGYSFNGTWNPNPNELTEDGQVSGDFTKVEDEDEDDKTNIISVDFMKKDPSKEDSAATLIKTLSAEPGNFSANEYPSGNDVEFGGYTFDGFKPEPNEMTESGKTFTQYKKDDSDAEENDEEDKNRQPKLSIDYRFKDPTKSNSINRIIYSQSITTDQLGKIDTTAADNELNTLFNQLSAKEDYRIDGWSPDPNEFRTEKDFGKEGVVQVDAVIRSNSEPEKKENTKSKRDLYIIPNKNLVSDNRKDAYSIASDGTVRAHQNMDDYKPDDFRE